MTQTMVMTAQELLDQLLDLQKERTDFDTLEVYISVVDQKTYDDEMADPPLDEMTDTIIADGAAYSLRIVTEYDMKVKPFKELGEYIVLCGVELEAEDAHQP